MNSESMVNVVNHEKHLFFFPFRMYSLSNVRDTSGKDFVKQLETGFGLVENLSKYYDKGTVKVKREIIGSMFPEKFIFEKSEVRTNHVDKTFLLLCRNSKGLKRIKEKDVSDKSKTSCKVTKQGFEPRTSTAVMSCTIQLCYLAILVMPFGIGCKDMYFFLLNLLFSLVLYSFKDFIPHSLRNNNRFVYSYNSCVIKSFSNIPV